MSSILTVSQLNRYVRAQLEENRLLQDIMVRGELSNFTAHRTSGHMYFSLKDKDSLVRAVMFRSHAAQLAFQPQNGMSVIARAQASLFERDGTYQLYIRELQPDGIGALYLAYEQLKIKLAAEGLFDDMRKKPLPRFPSVIGIITSETGAALQDILSVLERRYPLARVLLSPALVQGAGAPASLMAALDTLVHSKRCDVILIGRGGGGIEDLWAFNDEALARAIAACPVPIISAVGHETDYTICDFVADLRAPTPTAAAQLAVPDLTEVSERLYRQQLRLNESIRAQLAQYSARLRQSGERVGLRLPLAMLAAKREAVNTCGEELAHSMRRILDAKRTKTEGLQRLLSSYRVGRVLERGYSITRCGGKIVTDPGTLQPGDVLETTVAGGEIRSQVQTVCRREQDEKEHQL